MADPRWAAVDRYFAGLFAPADDALEQALRASEQAGLPPHEVSPLQGRLLQVLALSVGARRILEVGLLGGYSAIWLARALPPGGRLVALERDPSFADLARRAIAAAAPAAAVEVRVGPALETLPALAEEGRGPFDLVFLDADKAENADYLEPVLRLSRPGTLLVADNVVRDGAVLDPHGEAAARGVRRFAEALAVDRRVTATAVQTVGAKGWDGFVLAVVNARPGALRGGRA